MVGVSTPAPPGSKSIEDERPKKLLSLVQFAVNICQSDCDLKSLLCVKGNGYRIPHFPFRVSALLFLHLLRVTEKQKGWLKRFYTRINKGVESITIRGINRYIHVYNQLLD